MIASFARRPVTALTTRSRRFLSHHEDHHPHPTFTPPYSKPLIYGLATAIIGLGVGIPIAACIFQNRKHGFTK